MKHQAGPDGALCVAVVGHRRNRLPSERLPQLRAAIREILAELEVAGGERPKVLATGMADGADLVAAAERPAGWYLHAILTEPVETIAGSMLDEDSSALRRLLASPQALASVVAPGDDGFVRQADAILDQAHVLLAVWDGKPGSGPGGTADSILRALERKLPVLWLPADGGTPGFVDGVTNGEPSCRAITPDMLSAIFEPKRVGPDRAITAQ